MSETYNPQEIEPKWQAYWAENKQHETPDHVEGKDNYLLLTEFPYPSGNLHIGHWYAFALPDIRARYLRMQGKNVLYPIGFDAFGLPAENAAIKRGINPREWTEGNIAYMSKQLQSMGATFDWSRQVATIDPAYFRWTQWLFLKMYEKGLAYRATTTVNWCPKDKTVLANEQVVGGLCERCDTPVVQKEIPQWLFKITDYADRLVDDLAGLDWPETTKLAQQNWIGRTEGATIKFLLSDIPGQADAKHFVEVFTTRPDTLFGATAVVISPEVAKQWLDVGWQASGEVKTYVEASLARRELDRLEQTAEKTGVPAGINAINPATKQKVPVWVADYVLGRYGTGAVMAVPAHDERDWEFAKKFGLSITQVIASPDDAPQDRAYTGEGELINSGEYTGLDSATARQKIIETLQARSEAKFMKTYRLHDWVLSRQRYWGVPIPMIHCTHCDAYHPVPESDLPVELPALEDYLPSDGGRSPLAKATDWVKVACPKCGQEAERETDTMDTFVDSAWYFLRYTDPHNHEKFAEPAKMKQWLPVPMYLGGAEHNTMHLLYSRFFTKVLFDLKYVHFSEPFTARVNRGIILGPDSQKMSKSRGNVIDPDAEVATYGADTLRLYLAFMAPYEAGGPWDPGGITGAHRFIQRLWRFVQRAHDAAAHVVVSKKATTALHQATKKVGDDIDGLHLNTGVSTLMKLLNTLEAEVGHDQKLAQADYERLLLLVAPYAPHLAEELWQTVLQHTNSIHLESWPPYDAVLLASEAIHVPVQVNGRLRGTLQVTPDISEADLVTQAKALENVQKHLSDKEIVKTVVIPGRLVNFVVK
jgi:leucyl-tRNA synthetase